MKKIAAAYIRVSTDEQAELSPAAQKEDILDYAKKNDFYVPEEFIFYDEGISGKTEKRPSFQKMIATARKKSNRISAILVHKFDRFSRKKDDQVLYKALLKKEGIKVISVKEPIPDDDKFAVIYESMLEAMAEYYSLNLAEEVKKTMIKKAERGEYQTFAPFGYKNENKSLSIIPEEGEIIKLIFRKFTEENSSFSSIANFLNNMGIRTHRGNSFEGRTVKYILSNPVYCGYTRWKAEGKQISAKGSFQPIISEDIFEKAQKSISQHKQNHSFSSEKFFLSGIIKCSSCGKSLVVVKSFKNNGFYMQCGGYNHGICKISHSISSSALLPALYDAFKSMGSFSADLKISTAKNDDSILISKAKLRLERAKEAFLSGADTLSEYKSAKEKIEKEISEIKKSCLPHHFEIIPDIVYLLQNDNLSQEDKKAALCSVVDKMVYVKEANRLDIYLKL